MRAVAPIHPTAAVTVLYKQEQLEYTRGTKSPGLKLLLMSSKFKSWLCSPPRNESQFIVRAIMGKLAWGTYPYDRYLLNGLPRSSATGFYNLHTCCDSFHLSYFALSKCHSAIDYSVYLR